MVVTPVTPIPDLGCSAFHLRQGRGVRKEDGEKRATGRSEQVSDPLSDCSIFLTPLFSFPNPLLLDSAAAAWQFCTIIPAKEANDAGA
jgi:hypothetical protein